MMKSSGTSNGVDNTHVTVDVLVWMNLGQVIDYNQAVETQKNTFSRPLFVISMI